MATASKQKPAIQVRLDDELEHYLRSQAKSAYRTVNAEVQMRLERTRQQDLQAVPSMPPSNPKGQP